MPLKAEKILPTGQNSTHFPTVLMSGVLCIPYKLHWKWHIVNLARVCSNENKEKLLFIDCTDFYLEDLN